MSKEETNVADQLGSMLNQLLTENPDDKHITQISDQELKIDQQTYLLVKDYREGFNFDAFYERYQEYFEKFDFIVGDWAHGKLRLRGFYQLYQRRVPKDQTIDYLEDYLREFCNFECAYFVLAKEEAYTEYQQLIQLPLREPAPSSAGRVDTTKKIANRQRRRRRGRRKNQGQTVAKQHKQFKIEERTDVKKNQRSANRTKARQQVKKQNDFVIRKIDRS